MAISDILLIAGAVYLMLTGLSAVEDWIEVRLKQTERTRIEELEKQAREDIRRQTQVAFDAMLAEVRRARIDRKFPT